MPKFGKVLGGILLVFIGGFLLYKNYQMPLETIFVILAIIALIGGIYLIIRGLNYSSNFVESPKREIANKVAINNNASKSRNNINKRNTKGNNKNNNKKINLNGSSGLNNNSNSNSFKNGESIYGNSNNNYNSLNNHRLVKPKGEKSKSKINILKKSFSSSSDEEVREFTFQPNYEKPNLVTRKPKKKEFASHSLEDLLSSERINNNNNNGSKTKPKPEPNIFDNISKYKSKNKESDLNKPKIKTNYGDSDSIAKYDHNGSISSSTDIKGVNAVKGVNGVNDDNNANYNGFSKPKLSKKTDEPYNDLIDNNIGIDDNNNINNNSDATHNIGNNSQSNGSSELNNADNEFYVICENKILSSNEAVEKLILRAKDEILLEIPSLKSLSYDILANLSNASKIIIGEFDIKDMSYALLLSSLIKQNTEIRTLAIVNSVNMVVDDSYGLIISGANSANEGNESDIISSMGVGAVYNDFESISSIKEMFNKSWDIATEIKI
ncbi:MAG: hypothetical protein ACRCVG_00345 [Methanobacteriaceae archaeon]